MKYSKKTLAGVAAASLLALALMAWLLAGPAAAEDATVTIAPIKATLGHRVDARSGFWSAAISSPSFSISASLALISFF